MTIAEKLKALRDLMRKEKIDYYIISSTDPHQNEYLPEAWSHYKYISGFTGSNAELLIGLNQAYFWTDGRYAEQSKIEIAPELFETFIFAQGGKSNMGEFIAQNIENSSIGVDPAFISVGKAKAFAESFSAQGNTLVFTPDNLIAKIEKKHAPFQHNKIFALSEQYTGASAASKLAKLRTFIRNNKSEAIVLNELSSIAWLFNLRGSDIRHTPLFFSYAMIGPTNAVLFLDSTSLSHKVNDYLKALNVEVHDYSDFYKEISKLAPKKILLDGQVANQAMYNALHSHEVKLVMSPIAIWKACKTDAEIKGAIEAHRLDGIALVRFFTWLDHHKTALTEVSLAEKLLEFRAHAKSFQGTSFDTIAGFAEHGAIVHYRARPKTDKAIGTSAMLLIDSGAQYLEGTTDITRTVHLGEATDFEKHCYTLVLKGHLALKNAIFAEGTRGEQLDVLARQFLWQEGLNYAHGTGHGVGAFLCVHEGPQRISTGATATPLLPNMIVSNEPGIYFSGQFGIRIENLVYVKKAKLPTQPFGEFYTFANLTLVPYARNLIDKNLLTETEIDSINAYHTEILETLSSSLDVDSLRWLIDATKPL